MTSRSAVAVRYCLKKGKEVEMEYLFGFAQPIGQSNNP